MEPAAHRSDDDEHCLRQMLDELEYRRTREHDRRRRHHDRSDAMVNGREAPVKKMRAIFSAGSRGTL
jgi:hypothetical protein